MRAVVATPEGPELREVEAPVPGPEDVLVRVRAAGLNRADLHMMTGAAHGRTGGVGVPLGLEWAGEVVEAGAEAGPWRIGDRVMAAGGRAFAEYAVGHARRIFPAPEDLSFEEAATLPVALQTMHDAVATNGALQAGQAVLIQGASSGVGLMGLQIAKALGAGVVLGSSTSPERRARLAEFGADVAVDTAAEGWVEEVRAATGGEGADLVVDQVSGPLAVPSLKATRIGGRIVNVGRLGGDSGPFDFDLHALRRITYIGVTFRTRSGPEVEAIVARARAALWPALTAGRLRLPIDSVRPLENFAEALARMSANAHFGKIVLTMG